MKTLLLTLAVVVLLAVVWLVPIETVHAEAGRQDAPGAVRAANLIYGSNKTSVCFSDEFLVQIQKETNIRTHPRFTPVKMDTGELFDYPFAVMTGEGSFSLTDEQRTNLKDYLELGGFVVASAGCSSDPWNRSFKRELKKVFPDHETTVLSADHPVFHTVYDIQYSVYKRGQRKLPELHGLEIDGRIALIWSPDGLNDTANAGPSCCCCGGNEVKSARAINVNLLAYALTY
ncbi:MAG: DUF4159 domain-containing protein [Planctomycetota bacterium]